MRTITEAEGKDVVSAAAFEHSALQYLQIHFHVTGVTSQAAKQVIKGKISSVSIGRLQTFQFRPEWGVHISSKSKFSLVTKIIVKH